MSDVEDVDWDTAEELPAAESRHHCDICDTPFDDLVALIRHDCDDHRDLEADGGRDFAWFVRKDDGTLVYIAESDRFAATVQELAGFELSIATSGEGHVGFGGGR